MSGNVLFITSYYAPEWVACTIRTMYFVKALLDKGFNVTVLVTKYFREKKGTFMNVYGENVFKLSIPGLPPKYFLEPVMPAIASIKTKKYVEKVFDIVIATAPHPTTLYVAWNLKRMGLARKLVIDLRDVIPISFRTHLSVHSRTQAHLSTLGVMLIRHILSTACFIAVTTPSLLKYYKNYNSNIHVIYNGADYDLFAKYAERSFRKIKETTTTPTAIFIAARPEVKYHLTDTILKAIALLKKKRKLAIKLKIIGCTSYSKKVYSTMARSLGIAKDVELIGVVPYHDVPKFLCNGTFGIIGRPSTVEWKLAIPVKVYEYLACGLPVFVFGPLQSELRVFVKKFNVGMYVPSLNPRIIAESLTKFIEKLNEYDRNHILSIARLFDRRKWANKFADLVRECI